MQVPFLSLKDITDKYSAEIHEAVKRVVDSGWYLQGNENERFEKNYSNYIGSKYTIGCANGLDALIWILRGYIELGVMKPGDEVIVPANTYIASILAIFTLTTSPFSYATIIMVYSICTILPLFLIHHSFRADTNLADYLKLRSKNKTFFRFFLSFIYLLIAILIVLPEIISL